MKISQTRDMVTEQEIKREFDGTNYGTANPVDIVKWGLLKIACGYSTGHTTKCILQGLYLLSMSKNPTLTKRGQYCLWCFFEAEYNNE